MEREVAPEVAVVGGVASSHEGSQLLVSLARDEELTVKPVVPEKMARLGTQLHETAHLSKRGITGTTTLDASRLFMTFYHFHIAAPFGLTPSSDDSALQIAESFYFRFIMFASGYCPVQPR